METEIPKILIIEDDPHITELIEEIIADFGYHSVAVRTFPGANEYLMTQQPDVMIVDYTLQGENAREWLEQRISGSLQVPPFIISTGIGDEYVAVKMMKLGARDYVVKDSLFWERLPEAINRIVNDLKREKQIKQAEEEFNNFFNLVPSLICIISEEGYFLKLNPTWEKVLGYSLPELLSSPIKNFIHPEDHDILGSEIRQRIKNKSDKVFFSRFLHRDGSVKWLEWVSNSSPDGIRLYAGANDVTDRMIAEMALKESQSRLELFFAQSLDGFFFMMIDEPVKWDDTVDKEKVLDYVFGHQRITRVNDAMLEQYGAKEEDFLGLTPDTLFAHDIEGGRKVWKQFFDAGKLHVETDERKMDGTRMFIEGDYICLYTHDRKISGHFGIQRDVTKRKVAEEELKKSELEFRTIWESSLSGMRITDEDGITIRVNDAFCGIAGKSRGELEGLAFTEIYPEADREDFLVKHKTRFRMKNVQSNLEREIKLWNGRKIWIHLSNSFLELEGRKPYLLGVFTDITKRKNAEIALKRSNEFNETLLQTIPFGMDIIDENGNVLFMSKNFQEKFKQESIKNSKCWEIYRDDKTQCVKCPLREGVQTGHTAVIESSDVLNGRTFQITHTGMWFDEKKAILEIFQDITDKKVTEESLRKLNSAVEQNPVSILITDTNGNIEYVNPSFEKATGYTSKELISKKPSILKSGETSAKEYEMLWNTIKDGKVWTGEIHNKKKNGELFWESVSISPIIDENGEISHFLAVKEDITEKKKIMEELVLAKEKAEEMNRLKSSFLANMSHELRTPLIGILGFTEILAEELEKPDHRKMVNYISKGGKRLSETLNLILDFSMVDSNKIEINSKKFNVVTLIRELISGFSDEAEKKNLFLEFESETAELTVNLDERLFKGVLTNLISNAVKFTHRGGVEIRLGQEEISGRPWFYIDVEDTGIGIRKEDLELIFLEFRQVSEGIARTFEGNGLGLTLAKKITDLLGGMITVESEAGKGSVFTVKFPVSGESAASLYQKSKNPSERKPAPAERHKEKPRLLFVDDDETSQNVVELFLKNLFIIDTTNNGISAIEMAKKTLYDGFLMDINLGSGMDGLMVTKEIRKMAEYKNTPVIAVTAYAMAGDEEEFIAAGCTHYISKPFTKSMLIDLINSAILK